MKPSRLQAFVEYLLDNLFDIATIAVAAYLVIRYQVKPVASGDIAELATWILAVLGLIAVSGLWDRSRRLNRIEKLAKESRDLVLHHLSGKIHAADFFLSEHKLSAQSFASSNTIFLSGITLTRTTREYMHIFSQRLAAGAYIRVIIVDPTIDSVLQELVLRSKVGDSTAEFWRRSLEAVEAVVDATAQTPDSKGKLEIGYLPYIPSFGFVMIDPDERHGFCFVELYHHRSAEPKATFELDALDDAFWYGFFRRQYEILWKSCRIERLPKTSEPATEK
jgi:hypothetical protein